MIGVVLDLVHYYNFECPFQTISTQCVVCINCLIEVRFVQSVFDELGLLVELYFPQFYSCAYVEMHLPPTNVAYFKSIQW